jgi:hypothetical protein
MWALILVRLSLIMTFVVGFIIFAGIAYNFLKENKETNPIKNVINEKISKFEKCVVGTFFFFCFYFLLIKKPTANTIPMAANMPNPGILFLVLRRASITSISELTRSSVFALSS